MLKKKNFLEDVPPPISNDVPIWILIFAVGVVLIAMVALV